MAAPRTLGPSKAVSTAVFGALSVLVVQALSWAGIEVSPEAAQAITALIGTAATWFTPTTIS